MNASTAGGIGNCASKTLASFLDIIEVLSKGTIGLVIVLFGELIRLDPTRIFAEICSLGHWASFALHVCSMICPCGKSSLCCRIDGFETNIQDGLDGLGIVPLAIVE